METKPRTYRMLKTTTGSRDGITVDTFKKGETYRIAPDLAEQFYHQGAVEEVAAAEPEKAEPVTAKNRSTKVTGPAATKVTGPEDTKAGEAGVPLETQHIEELVAVARDHYGLDADSTMSEGHVRAMIEAAEADGAEPHPAGKASGRKNAKGKK